MQVLETDPLFTGLEKEQTVWMSHGDAVSELEGDFQVLATSDHSPYAAVRHASEPFYGLQFHPEVSHTPGGAQVIRNFLIEICGLRGDWRMTDFRRVAVEACREQVGDAHVVLGLSGGVDSAVVAALVHEAIGERLHSIFVDNGLLREGESDQVVEAFSAYEHFDLTRVDATDQFLDSLAGVTDPEEKRKRIGHVFIEVFEEAAKAFPDVKFLAQGTLYPDVIESVPAHGGPTAKIKSHHNVGGLPETLGFELLEPLRYLFKDEVRMLGEELGLPESILWRQPFPGPGLAIRIAGDITRDRLTVLRQADTIVRQEIDAAGLTRKLWQSFCCLVPVQTVGVMGDERTYEDLIAVRAVESADGMTADWARLPADLLDRIANRVIGEVRGVNRVVYDITSKPPGTIEWE
jgi:GMP synthase (glutamine-hydrolysing)